MNVYRESHQQVELIGTYLGERFRFDNPNGQVIVGSVYASVGPDETDEVSVKGQADDGELQVDQVYRFLGKWSKYKNKRTGKEETQFHFNSFVRQQPVSRQGIVSYLKQAGEGHGFGGIRANKMWELFGQDAVRMMREESSRVAEELTRVKLPISAEATAKIAAVLQSEIATEGSLLDLTDLFANRGFPKGAPKDCIREWGARAAQIVRRNPYLLMKRVRGCGFKRCDALYLHLGHPPGRLKRQALCAWYSVASDTNGHTWYPIEFIERGLRGSIGGSELRDQEAITLATRAKYLAELRTETNGGPLVDSGTRRWLAEEVKANSERELALCVAGAMREKHDWPAVSTVEGIDDHQREQLAKSLAGPISILGGSPGTGKTYTAAALIKRLIDVYGKREIAIGAPTGKAAVRITEVMAKQGIDIRARTWHSLIALVTSQKMSHFPYKVLIGDEQSMQDCDMAAAVFRRRAKGTVFLIVGDVNQLPPVGHGAPLRDLIAAGLPYGELTEIKRNSGGIVEACAAIRDGRPWSCGDNLTLVDASDPQQQIEAMLREIKSGSATPRDAIWDCQVLVPVNKKSPLARKELNKILQNQLNSHSSIAGSPFRVGDKIVNTANGHFPAIEFDQDDPDAQTNEKGEVYVANGELGEVIQVAEKYCVATLTAPARTIRIPMGKYNENEIEKERPTEDGDGENSDKTGTGCSWDLGYALSVHKSQGSEWPRVIVMVDSYPGAKMVCSREWLYTAISRAKQKCTLIGKKTVADAMCRRIALHNRKTFLRELIRIEQAKLVIGEL